MKHFNKKRFFSIFLTFLLLTSLIPPMNTNAISVVNGDGLSISDTKKYKITKFSTLDYYYRENWDVKVDGVSKGQMVLMVPPGLNSNEGRTFADYSTLYSWGAAFGGNPDHVREQAQSTTIRRVNDGVNFSRYYSVDIGRLAGAKVIARSGTGGQGYLEVSTSRFPLITKLQAPPEVRQNTDFNVTFSGVEYDPFSSEIDYKIAVNGVSKATGRLSAGQLGSADSPETNGTFIDKIEPIRISGTGTYTIELTLTDHIKRSSTKTTTVTVKAAPPTGTPYLEVTPDLKQIQVGEIASYQAFYYDSSGNKTDVTTNGGTTWTSFSSATASLQAKGQFKGLKEGSLSVRAQYNGLQDLAQLVVDNQPAPPPPDPVIPREVSVGINGPNEVMIGEKFCLQGFGSSSPDGSIVSYNWGFNGFGTFTDASGCDLSYPAEGLQTVTLTVTDDKGNQATTEHFINVIKPQPTAKFTWSGTNKENRKMTLQATHPYNNRNGVLDAYPMVEEKWTITAMDPANQPYIKTVQNISGNVTYNQLVDILLKVKGDYKVKRYVKNSIGLEDTMETVITVEPDLRPTANFSVITTLYRDDVREQPDHSKATIKLTDKSYSRDDSIAQRIWTYRYDSNNDGQFTEDAVVISNTNEESVQIAGVDKVGKYLIELQVIEQYDQPTIEAFVVPADRRRHQTDQMQDEESLAVKPLSERIVNLDNLAPNVSYDVQQRKTVELQINVGLDSYSMDQWQTKLNEYLKPKLSEKGYDSLITVKDSRNPGVMKIGEVGAGENANLFLINGELYGLGSNGYGGLGHDPNVLSYTSVPVKVPTPGGKKIVQVDSSGDYSAVLTEDGEVYTFGENYGRLGNNNLQSTYLYQKVIMPVKVKKVATGENHLVILGEDKNVYSSGYNDEYQLGVSSIPYEGYAYAPVKMENMSNVVDIATGQNSTIMQKEDGSLWGIGMSANTFGTNQLVYSSPTRITRTTNAKAIAADGTSFIWLDTGQKYDNHSIAFITSDDKAVGYMYGKGDFVFDKEKVVSIAMGEEHLVIITESGNAYGMGNNRYNAFGMGMNTGYFSEPTLITGLSNVAFAEANDHSTVYVLKDGSVKVTGGGGHIGLTGGDTATNPRTLELPKGAPPYDFKESKNTLFTALVNNQPDINVNAANQELIGLNSKFIGIGNQGNKSQMEQIITQNKAPGTFIDNTNLDLSVQSLTEYILNQIDSKDISLQIDVTDSPYTIEQLKAAEPVAKNLLSENKINSDIGFYKRGDKINNAISDSWGGHYAFIKSDGTVVGKVPSWSYIYFSPSLWYNMKTIAMNGSAVVGIRKDGTIVTEGMNNFNQLNLSDITNPKDIQMAGDITFVLTSDKRIIGRGYHTTEFGAYMNWSNIESMKIGHYQVTIVARDSSGKFYKDGHGTSLMDFSDWSNVIDYDAEGGLVAGLTNDNKIKITGYGANDGLKSVVSQWTDIVKVQVGQSHVVGLKRDGTVVAANTSGTSNAFTNVGSWTNIVDIMTDVYGTFGVRNDGTVLYTGNNTNEGYTVNTSHITGAFAPSLPIDEITKPNYFASISNKAITATTYTEILKTKESSLIGIGNSLNKVTFESVIAQNNGGGTFMTLPSTISDSTANDLMSQIAAYIIQDRQSDKVDLGFGIGNYNVTQETLRSKVSSIIVPKLNANGIQISNTHIENSTQYSFFTGTNDNMGFFALIDNNSQTTDQINKLSGNLLSSGYHFGGLGNTLNQSAINNIISKNMNKGIFIDNTVLDTALSQYADYVIAEVKRLRGIKEVYVTLDEQVDYFTTYHDYENDPKMADRWKYDHLSTVFENNMGQDSRQMLELSTPIQQFSKVGRYQPYYSAKDNPIFWGSSKFSEYQKWAKDADNWYIYVHRKPVPEFSFIINGTTGAYTLTNTAFDLDKYSINVGYGPGLKSQKWSWRLQGESVWKEGLPPSPLERKVYEVKNSVVDFQNREEYLVKILDGTGVNKAPIADFEPIPNIVFRGENVLYRNFSYDPNGDPLTYEWSWKKDGAVTWTNGTPTNSGDVTKEPATQFNQVGKHIVRLRVKDSLNSYSAYVEKTVEVLNRPPSVVLQYTPVSDIKNDTVITFTANSNDPDSADVPLLTYKWEFKEPNTSSFTTYTSTSKTFNRTLPTVGDWEVRVTVTDPYGATAQDTKTIKVVSANNPPKAGFTTDKPQYYIGDIINVTSTATDPDGDVLTHLYTLTTPSGLIVTKNTANFTYQPNEIGTFSILQTVSDGKGGTDSMTKTVIVDDLTVVGNVYHTDEWLDIHLRQGNMPLDFYSGEKFLLAADVSNAPIQYVKVQALGESIDGLSINDSTTLTATSTQLYEGVYYKDSFADPLTLIKKSPPPMMFTFEVKYTNGTIRNDIIYVNIIGSIYDVLNYHQKF